MTGFYLMHRGWLESPVFAKEAFTEREAWVWLIEEANYKPDYWNICGRKVLLPRAQLSHAIRHLSETWGWNKSKTERYLGKLKKWDMIETRTETGQLVITICNYDEYQDGNKKNETDTRQERDKSETQTETAIGTIYIEKEEKKKRTINPIIPLPEWCPSEAWKRFEDHRKAKRAKLTPYSASLALKELDAIRRKGHDPTRVIDLAILKNWTTFYEPKDPINAKPTNADRAKSAVEQRIAKIAADRGLT